VRQGCETGKKRCSNVKHRGAFVYLKGMKCYRLIKKRLLLGASGNCNIFFDRKAGVERSLKRSKPARVNVVLVRRSHINTILKIVTTFLKNTALITVPYLLLKLNNDNFLSFILHSLYDQTLPENCLAQSAEA
jgi:hypothetical protein